MHAHTPPVAHLDIKPSNILVRIIVCYHKSGITKSFFTQVEEGLWKVFLGDFGLCQVMTGTNIIGTRTMLAGSPGFQSPEQLRSESLGLPSDVYALGAVLLVLFGERAVWPALSPFQIMYKVTVCHQKPETGHLPPQIKALCDACFLEVASRPPANLVLERILNMTK